jgi:hypothetical protein
MPNPAGESMVMKKLNLRKQGKIIGAITLLVCLLLLSGSAKATAIYDNLNGGGDFFDNLNGAKWTGLDGSNEVISLALFDSFSVGPDGFKLLDVKLLLTSTSESSGSFSVAIYSNTSSGTPNLTGSPLTTIGSRSDDNLPLGEFKVVDFLLAEPFDLAQGQYWLVLDTAKNSPTSSAGWGWSAYDEKDTGVIGEQYGYFDPNTSSDYSGYHIFDTRSYGAYRMQLSSTPLPPSLLLLGSGLAGLGLLRFKKRFRA